MSVRAAVIDRFGDPDEFRIADVEMPPVAPDAARVEVAADGADALLDLVGGGKLVLQVRS